MFDFSMLDIFINLGTATILGLLIGIERTAAGKTAGMRTFALVSTGSALFITISIIVTNTYLGHVSFAPMRVASSIISGIGFIGAGLILFRNDAVKGLTTAAGLWTSAGVGIACGYGLYTIAFFTTLLILFIFTVAWIIENKLKIFLKKESPAILEEIITLEEEIDE